MRYYSILKLLALKGIKIPITIFIVISTIFILAHIEDLVQNNLNYFNPDESANQYVCSFIFTGFILFFCNRINFIYLLSNQNNDKGLLYKNISILSISAIYTLIYISIYKISFLLAGLEMTFEESSSYFLRTFLFALSSGLFFSMALNLSNSYPTLFLIYFTPIILKGLLFILYKFGSINLKPFLPFDSTGVDSNLTLVGSILLFGILANLTHKAYYIK